MPWKYCEKYKKNLYKTKVLEIMNDEYVSCFRHEVRPIEVCEHVVRGVLVQKSKMALDVFSSVKNLFKPEDLTIDNFVFQVK